MAIQESPIVLSPVLRDLIRMRVVQEDDRQVAGRPQSALSPLGWPPQTKAAAALEATRGRFRPQGLPPVTQFQYRTNLPDSAPIVGFDYVLERERRRML